MGVKVFPPSESILSFEWLLNEELNPWWLLYQPVSYKLYSRMGDRAALRAMIDTCRRAGVRVYADAVNNHMTGGGNDIQSHRNGGGQGSCTTWGPKSSSTGTSMFGRIEGALELAG
jgi:alpha-amylase